MFTCKNGHEDVVKLLLNLLSRIIIDWDIRNIRSLRSLISQNCHLGAWVSFCYPNGLALGFD